MGMDTEIVLQNAQDATKRQLELFDKLRLSLGKNMLNAYMSIGGYLVIESFQTKHYYRRIYGLRGGCKDIYCYKDYDFTDKVPYHEVYHSRLS